MAYTLNIGQDFADSIYVAGAAIDSKPPQIITRL